MDKNYTESEKMTPHHSSILDTIIESWETQEREKLQLNELISRLFNSLNDREAEILQARFGLSGVNRRTLEQIGRQYNITRERVRQIEKLAIQNIKQSHNFKNLISPLQLLVLRFLRHYGNVRLEESLIRDIAGPEPREIEASILKFIFKNLLTDTITVLERKDTYPAWQIKDTDLNFYDRVISQTVAILEAAAKPLSAAVLIDRLKQSDWFVAETHRSLQETEFEKVEKRIDKIFESFFEISKYLKKNPFTEWGLAEWPTITPKRMADKIYLVLKHAGKPLHFKEITRLVNRAKFDSKEAYAPTVHNELILDKRFVLVGRGVYALREWGYQEGTVADILVSLLEKRGEPMTRQELIEGTLKQRLVKKGTIYLALTDKRRFKRLADGRIALVGNK